jgi:hypothetical protein
MKNSGRSLTKKGLQSDCEIPLPFIFPDFLKNPFKIPPHLPFQREEEILPLF